MNTCLWCNNSVSERDTVWVRKNLLLGYKFCSRRCASQWESINKSSQSITAVPKSIQEIQLEQEEKRLLREQRKQENLETAEKIMKIVTHLYPHRKWLIPLYIIVFIISLFVVAREYQSIVVIGFAIPVIAIVWAYFTDTK